VRFVVFAALAMKNTYRLLGCDAVWLRSVLQLLVTVNVPSLPILFTLMMGGKAFLRNVAYYKSHTA
jgi:hypothetical protein